jgi:gliding motility-associated-like protein
LEWYSDATLLANIGSGTNLTPGSSLGSTVYYVNETSNGCVGPATAITVTITTCVVIVVEIPTGFSPDNDGVNDTWELVNLNLAYPNNIVRVFNRWGTILFESNGYATPWDGKVNGDDLPTASYFFTIDFGDGIRDPETGSVTIIR